MKDVVGAKLHNSLSIFFYILMREYLPINHIESIIERSTSDTEVMENKLLGEQADMWVKKLLENESRALGKMLVKMFGAEESNKDVEDTKQSFNIDTQTNNSLEKNEIDLKTTNDKDCGCKESQKTYLPSLAQDNTNDLSDKQQVSREDIKTYEELLENMKERFDDPEIEKIASSLVNRIRANDSK